ncbi:TIGR00270 family protein [Candidatus Woesearchaeota archaeon]|nr:TIGR00270 family protein [Candidatus Woesearchaeota archaeon]
MIKNLKPCEMCGKHDSLTDTLVEGSVLSVCRKCTKFGTLIKKTDIIYLKKPKKEIKLEEVKEFITPEYSKLIKDARERLKLNQEDLGKMISERESIIRQLEQGHMKPTFSLAKKLEQYLKIRLIESNEPKEKLKDVRIDFSNAAMTIGDLLKMRKK